MNHPVANGTMTDEDETDNSISSNQDTGLDNDDSERTCLGEIQAMNLYAGDMLVHEEDFEHAATVLDEILEDLISPNNIEVEPTFSNPELEGHTSHQHLQQSHRTHHHHDRNKSQVDIYFLGIVGSFDTADYCSCNSGNLQQVVQEEERKEGTEDFYSSCFLRRPCCFECVQCNNQNHVGDNRENAEVQQQPPLPSSRASPMLESQAQEEPECCTSGASVSPQKYGAVTMTCLYNRALCYHFQWYEAWIQNERIVASNCQCQLRRQLAFNEDSNLRHLVQALKYYEQAFDIALKSSTADGPPPSSTKKTTGTIMVSFPPSDPFWDVFMAVCTNAAHCAMELSLLNQIHIWNARLYQALHYTRSHHKDEEQKLHDDMEQLRNATASPQTLSRSSAGDSETQAIAFLNNEIEMNDRNNNNDRNNGGNSGDNEDDESWRRNLPRLMAASSRRHRRYLAKLYRSFLWDCAFKHKVSGSGAPIA